MATSVRSFGKINLGLKIGPLREDGFHELRTIYQTIALSDTVRVDVSKGVGIEVVCKDNRVPCDESNTCWRVADRILRSLKTRGKIRIAIDKTAAGAGWRGRGLFQRRGHYDGAGKRAETAACRRTSGCALLPKSALICRCF